MKAKIHFVYKSYSISGLYFWDWLCNSNFISGLTTKKKSEVTCKRCLKKLKEMKNLKGGNYE